MAPCIKASFRTAVHFVKCNFWLWSCAQVRWFPKRPPETLALTPALVTLLWLWPHARQSAPTFRMFLLWS